MWIYYATRFGEQGEVEWLLRHDGQRSAEVYHRQNGWYANSTRFNTLRLSGDLDAQDIISEEQAKVVVAAWQKGEKACLPWPR